MSVVTALINKDIEDSHLQEIKDLLQIEFDKDDPGFTQNSLIEMNVVQFQEEISSFQLRHHKKLHSEDKSMH